MKVKKFLKNFSLLPYGLRYKLLIAFSLMSVLPLLVIGYLVHCFVVLEAEPSLAEASIITLLSIVIAWLGLFLAKNIIERVVDLALDTRTIREGDYDRKVIIDTEDEIGQIGEAINFLTQKIKNNMTDLKDYQAKIEETNTEIQKRISVLSSLLRIGELISASVKLDDILEFALSKVARLYDDGFAALYFSSAVENRFTLRAGYNLDFVTDTLEDGKDILGRPVFRKKYTIMDASSKFALEEEKFLKAKYKCENMAIFPIIVARGFKALLIGGNNIKNFTYTDDDIKMVKVFVEQISIAVESDILMHKAEKLEIKDGVTNLFNKPYITRRLKDEIDRSIVSQRPCSFVLINIDDFKKYQEQKGQPQAEIALKKIAHLVNESSLPIGRAGRIDQDTFALILPEVNKKEALEIAETLRKKIENLELSSEKGDRLTASGGVSENPLDGSDPEEILRVAEEALAKAKQKGKNKVAV